MIEALPEDVSLPSTAAMKAPSDKAAVQLSQKEAFAREWQFASFLEMFEATTPLDNPCGKKKWLLTALSGGRWLLWIDSEINTAKDFNSRDEALQQIDLA